MFKHFLNAVQKRLEERKLSKPPEKTETSRRDHLREKILDAAESLIAEHGLGGLKAREVAGAAGCALGAIYTVFADLDEVILRVGLRTLARLEEALSAPGEGDALDHAAFERKRSNADNVIDFKSSERDPSEKPASTFSHRALERLALAYLAFARRETPSWRALFDYRLPPGASLPDWFAIRRDRLFTLLEAPLSALLPERAAEEVRREARTLFSAVHGIVALGLEEKLGESGDASLEAELSEFVVTFSRGLAAAKEKLAKRPARGNRQA